MKNNLRLYALAFLGVAAIGGTAGAARGSKPPEPECVVAARWAKAHVDELPRTLSGISSYKLAYRQAIYAQLTRAERLSLWHEQFEYYGKLASLSSEQRSYLASVDRELDEYFGPERNAAAEDRYHDRAVSILGPALAKDVFANLGINTLEQRESAQPGALQEACACSTSSDWCGPTGLDCGTGISCTGSTSGCGTFWCHACNGSCTGSGGNNLSFPRLGGR